MRRTVPAAVLVLALAGGVARAQQPLTLEVTPDEGTQFAVRRAGRLPHPVVGQGGVAVEAHAPAAHTRLRASGENAVVTVSLP